MQRNIVWVAVIGVVTALVEFLAHIWPELAAVLLSMLLVLALVVTLFTSTIIGVWKWRRQYRGWWLPALMCVAFLALVFYGISPVAQIFKDWQFKRHIVEFDAAVHGVADGSTPCQDCALHVDEVNSIHLPPHVKAFFARRCGSGSVLGVFLLSSDVPLLHEGYMFQQEEPNRCTDDTFMTPYKLQYVRHVTGNWYHFADQPGL